MDDVPRFRNLCAFCVNQLLGAILHLGSLGCSHRRGHRAVLGLSGKLHHQVDVTTWRGVVLRPSCVSGHEFTVHAVENNIF